jgi:hypothetical protein
MLIAASASRTGRILVTRNIKHFEGCGVPLLNPFSKPKMPAGATRRSPALERRASTGARSLALV